MIETLIFDLDDTLYPKTTGVWDAIGERINLFVMDSLSIDLAGARRVRDELFHEYGTTLRGMQEVYGIDPYAYLNFVHNIPLENYLQPNPNLRKILKSINGRKTIFTNADQNHAMRVIDQLGLSGIFERIIDVMDVAPYCKPQPEAFEQALRILGGISPSNCVIIEDSISNVQSARQLGFYTVLVGNHFDYDNPAHATLASLEELPRLANIPFLSGIWRVD